MEEIYPPFKSTISGELLEKAKRELNENPDTRNEEIKILRERVRSYPGLKARLDSEFLIRFLRARKFDQEAAFKLIIKYYKMRNDYPEIFKELLPSCLTELIDCEVTGVLDERDKEGRRVVLMRVGKWDPEKNSLDDAFKLNYLILSKLIEEEETQINGIIFFCDMSEFGWNHAKAVNPLHAGKLAAALLQEAFPARFKGIHHIKEPSLFDYIFLVLKQFLKEKVVNRIYFHGDRLDELRTFVDEQYIPEEYGGKGPTFTTKGWTDKLILCEEEFEEEMKYGLFETTPVSSKESEDAFTSSVTGTFRKLDI